MRSLKEECVERMIFFGEKSLHAATVSYVDHFLTERNHQGVGNRLLIPGREVARSPVRSCAGNGSVDCCVTISAKLHDLGRFITEAVREQPDRVHSRPCVAQEPNG
jgi:hypothetical protein